jgi:DegV family protein with EDD domain
MELAGYDFYHRLESSLILPTTSAPSPGAFAKVFDELATKHTEIMGIFLARKLSATYDAAVQGVKLMKRKCQVELVDSTLAVMGQGLLVMEVAKKALAGASLDELASIISRSIPRIYVRVTLDTLKYLARGGRIGKAQAMLGSMLNINPILGIKNGEVFPSTMTRSRAKAVDWLYGFAAKFHKVKALAVEYGNNVAEAKALAKRLTSIFPQVPLYLSNVSPVIGTHAGPNVLAITILEED